jgi:hypothetical protein
MLRSPLPLSKNVNIQAPDFQLLHLFIWSRSAGKITGTVYGITKSKDCNKYQCKKILYTEFIDYIKEMY